MNEQKSQYNISSSGRQCIGPCYKRGTMFLHPITLEYMINHGSNICPTYRWWDNTEKKYKIYDICIPSNTQTDTTLGLLSPTLNFDSNQFIKMNYDIYSFASGITWLLNNIYNEYKSLRVSECLWNVYGTSIDTISDDTVRYYINFFKQYWVKYVYNSVKKYIIIDNGTIRFINKPQNNVPRLNKIEIINFLIKKLITYSNIYNVLNKYIKIIKHKDKHINIKHHNKNILNIFINYCINNIKNM
jgi:hypothetical protein